MPVQPIEERTALSPDEFVSFFLLPQRPIILRSAIAHWPAVSKWSPQYLKTAASGIRVEVRSKSDYASGGSKRRYEEATEVAFSDVVDMMNRDDAPDMSYARQTTVWKNVLQLVADIGPLGYGPNSIVKTEGNLWIGPSGTVAQLHWDPVHNLFAQIRGEKKWILVSPSESHLTYPNKFSIRELIQHSYLRETHPELMNKLETLLANRINIEEIANKHLSYLEQKVLHAFLAQVNNCDVNVEAPDLKKNPLFFQTTHYEATLKAGDLMFIPYCWRHYVRSLTPSVSLNWFFPLEGRIPPEARMGRTLVEHLVP